MFSFLERLEYLPWVSVVGNAAAYDELQHTTRSEAAVPGAPSIADSLTTNLRRT
ncbi:MAG: hypothetical protein ACI8PT_003615 [Gammaproteobacteria bacterium]|jgi:hypothetical protein